MGGAQADEGEDHGRDAEAPPEERPHRELSVRAGEPNEGRDQGEHVGRAVAEREESGARDLGGEGREGGGSGRQRGDGRGRVWTRRTTTKRMFLFLRTTSL